MGVSSHCFKKLHEILARLITAKLVLQEYILD